MSPRVLTTLAMLLAGLALNLVVEVLLSQEKEIAELRSRLQEQFLTIQELVIKDTMPAPETEPEMVEIKE
jgi:hypothetical protein